MEQVLRFNQHRLLGPIGYFPPAEAEANYWWEQQRQAMQV